MPETNTQTAPSQYDPRWFIWTIVFLVVTGISLVSYIVFSDPTANDAGYVVPVRAINHKPVVPQTPQKTAK